MLNCQNETQITISYPVIQFLLRINGSNAALPTTTKRSSVSVWVALRPDPSSLCTCQETLSAWMVPTRCSRATVTSGELNHSSIKNMQIVMSDSRDPIMLQLSRHLPVHQVTKYKHTNHTIVVQPDTTVHTVSIVFSRNIVKYRIFALSSAVNQADEASNNCADRAKFTGLINIHGECRSSQNEYGGNAVRSDFSWWSQSLGYLSQFSQWRQGNSQQRAFMTSVLLLDRAYQKIPRFHVPRVPWKWWNFA